MADIKFEMIIGCHSVFIKMRQDQCFQLAVNAFKERQRLEHLECYLDDELLDTRLTIQQLELKEGDKMYCIS